MGFIWSRNHAIIERGIFPLKNRDPLISFQCQRFSSVWMTATYSHYTDFNQQWEQRTWTRMQKQIFLAAVCNTFELVNERWWHASSNPKVLYQAKISFKHVCRTVLKQLKIIDAFLLEHANRNLSLSLSMTLINGACPWGASHCAQ